MSLFDGIHKGALHRQLGVPEDEPIPGGKAKMGELCRGSIGDSVMVNGHDVIITKKIHERSCFAYRFGYHKKGK